MKDIERFFPAFSKRIQVIPNPVPTLFKFSPQPFNKLHPRILQVGTGKHKNLPTLFAAIANIPCRLVIIGPLDDFQRNLLKQYEIEYEQFQNLSSEEVYDQYVKCDLISFVTTHEGFGMPVLEAQAVGRPILTSQVCSLPEVSNGSSATVIDPLDVQEVRAALQRIIWEPAYREDLIRAGRHNIQRFEMEKIVAAYVQLYKSVAD